MLLPLLALLVAADPKVIVVDVSAPDAVYEDISRALADAVVAELREAGMDAVRIGENELPEGGCRIGPCLGEVSFAYKAKVVVIVDATEVDKKTTSVSLAAMAGHNGMPIGARRYLVKADLKAPKELKTFIADLAKKVVPPPKPDAGAAGDAGSPPK